MAGRRKRKRGGTVVYVLIILILLLFIAGVVFYSRFGFSKEMADLNDYYSLTADDQVGVVIDNSVMGAKGIVISDAPYLDYDVVSDYISSRFYVDKEEGLLLYAMPTELIRIKADEKTYKIAGEEVKEDIPIWTVKDDVPYIAMNFISRYSAVLYEYAKDPNRLMITTSFGDVQAATAKRDTNIRKLAGVKSPILKEVKKDEELIYLDTVDNWYHVKSSDGFIGYVPTRDMNDLQNKQVKCDYQEPEFEHMLEDGKICLAFDNVTNTTANGAMEDRLKDSKGVNVIAPTWFTVANTKGKIDSIASKEYVDKAHKKGMKVWATFRDFDSDGINSAEETFETLNSSKARAAMIKAVMEQVKKTGIDGVNVDFEKINTDCGKAYVEFIRELSIACRNAGKTLSVDNYVPKAYNTHYGRKEQGIFADYVVIMGYDEHTYGSEEAGSVASYDFVEDGINKTIADVQEERVINAIPFYTRIWKETTEGKLTLKDYGMAGAAAEVKKAGAKPVWDDQTHQDYAEWVKDNVTYRVWLENAKSIKDKLTLMQGYDLGGVGVWRLGQETKDVWPHIAAYLKEE